MVHAADIILSGLNDQVLQSSSGPIVIFQNFLQLSRYSLDGLELGPLDLFANTLRILFYHPCQ